MIDKKWVEITLERCKNEDGHDLCETLAQVLFNRVAELEAAARQDAERIASRDQSIESLQRRVSAIGAVARAEQMGATANLARITILEAELHAAGCETEEARVVLETRVAELEGSLRGANLRAEKLDTSRKVASSRICQMTTRVTQLEADRDSHQRVGIRTLERAQKAESRVAELETWTSELDKLAKFYAQERDAALARVRELESKLSLANDRHLTLERETQWTSGEIHLGGEIISVRFRGELHLSPIHQEVKVHA